MSGGHVEGLRGQWAGDFGQIEYVKRGETTAHLAQVPQRKMIGPTTKESRARSHARHAVGGNLTE